MMPHAMIWEHLAFPFFTASKGSFAIPWGSYCCSQLVFLIVLVVVHKFSPHPQALCRPPLLTVEFWISRNCIVVQSVKNRLEVTSYKSSWIPSQSHFICSIKQNTSPEQLRWNYGFYFVRSAICHLHTDSNVCHIRAGNVKCIEFQVLGFQIFWLVAYF